MPTIDNIDNVPANRKNRKFCHKQVDKFKIELSIKLTFIADNGHHRMAGPQTIDNGRALPTRCH